ncbi:polyprotein [Root lesion nematode virus]|nr:polyprotein [Root lesion nematode virus]
MMTTTNIAATMTTQQIVDDCKSTDGKGLNLSERLLQENTQFGELGAHHSFGVSHSHSETTIPINYWKQIVRHSRISVDGEQYWIRNPLKIDTQQRVNLNDKQQQQFNEVKEQEEIDIATQYGIVAQMDSGQEFEETVGNLRMQETRAPIEETTPEEVSERTQDANTGITVRWPEDELFARWQHLARFSWKLDAKDWTILSFDILQQLMVSPHYYTRIMSIYAYVKMDLRFKLQLNSTKQHVGRLALVWIPPTKKNAIIDVSLPCVELFSTLPHICLDASQETPVILRVPFTQVANYLTTLGSRNSRRLSLGDLSIIQMTNLYAPEGSNSSIDGTIWVSVVKHEFKIPVASHLLFTSKISAQGEISEQISTTAGRLAAMGVKRMVKRGLEAIPGIGPWLDRPLDLEFGTARRPPCMPPMAISSGFDPAVRLSLHNARLPQSRYLSDVDMSHVDTLCKLSTVVVRLAPKWTIGEGTQKFFLPVHPRLCAPPSAWNRGQVQAGFLNYISSLYKYWRGSLTFHIEIIAAYFATGRIGFTWLPEVDGNLGAERDILDDYLAFPTVILELGESREITFSVPYISDTPIKFIPDLVCTDVNKYFYSNKYCNGVLMVHVINQIVVPPPANNFVSVWVSLSAGNDFELMVPAGPFSPVNVGVVPNLDKIKVNHNATAVEGTWRIHKKQPKKEPNMKQEHHEIAKSSANISRDHIVGHLHRLRHPHPPQEHGGAPPQGSQHPPQVDRKGSPGKGTHAQSDDGVIVPRGQIFRNGSKPMERSNTTPGPSLFGETFVDLKELMKRKMLIYLAHEGKYMDNSTVSVTELVVPVTPLTNGSIWNSFFEMPEHGWLTVSRGRGTIAVTVEIEKNWDRIEDADDLDTFMSMISRLFVFYSGSIRYTVCSTSGVLTPGILSAEFVPGRTETKIQVNIPQTPTALKVAQIGEPRGNYAFVIDTRIHNPVLDFEVPIQGLYDHLYVTSNNEIFDSICGNVVILSTRSTTVDVVKDNDVLRVYAGAGNDFELHMPAGVPPIMRYLVNGPGATISKELGYEIQNDGIVAQSDDWFQHEPWFERATLIKICGGIAICGAGIYGCYKFGQYIDAKVTNIITDTHRLPVLAQNATRHFNHLTGEAERHMQHLIGRLDETTAQFNATMTTVRNGTHLAADYFEQIAVMLRQFLAGYLGPDLGGLVLAKDIIQLMFLIYDATRLTTTMDLMVFYAKIGMICPNLFNIISRFRTILMGAPDPFPGFPPPPPGYGEVHPEEAPPVHAQSFGLHDVIQTLLNISHKNVTIGAMVSFLVLLIAKTRMESRNISLFTLLKSQSLVSIITVIANDLFKALTDMGKISASIFAISRALPILESVIEKILCFLKGDATAQDLQVEELREISERAVSWAKRVVEMNQDSTRLRLSHDSSLQREIKNLHAEGLELFSAAHRRGVDAPASRAFERMLAVSGHLEQIANRSRSNLGYRREPFCFCLSGEPGVGKTTILRTLMQHLGKLEDHGGLSDIYARSSEDEYWSGYAGQHGVLYDDFPKANAPESAKVMYEFINVKSGSPYPLTMADIPDKGTFITSRIVGVTTNNPYFVPPGMLEPQAFLRRRDVMVKMVGKNDGFTFSSYRFKIMNPLNRNPVPEPEMNLEEFKEYLLQAYIGWNEKEAIRLRAIGVPLDRVLDEFDGALKPMMLALFDDGIEGQSDVPSTSQEAQINRNPNVSFSQRISDRLRVNERYRALMEPLRHPSEIAESEQYITDAFSESYHTAIGLNERDDAFMEEQVISNLDTSNNSLYQPESQQPPDTQVFTPRESQNLIEPTVSPAPRAYWDQFDLNTQFRRTRSRVPIRRALPFNTYVSQQDLAVMQERFTPEEVERLEIAASRADLIREMTRSDPRIERIVEVGRMRGLSPREALLEVRQNSAMYEFVETVRRMPSALGEYLRGLRNNLAHPNLATLLSALCIIPIGMVIWLLFRRDHANSAMEQSAANNDIDDGPTEVVVDNCPKKDRAKVILETGADPQFENEPQTGDRHLGEYGRHRQLKKGSKTQTKSRKSAAFRKRGGVAQVDYQNDQNLQEMMDKIRNKAIIEITVKIGGEFRKLLGCGIGKRVAIFPGHYMVLLDSLNEDLELYVRIGHRTINMKYSELDVRYFEEKDEEQNATLDLAAVLFPPSIENFPTLKNYFLADSELEPNHHCSFILDVYSPNPEFPRRTVQGNAALSRYTDGKFLRYPVQLNKGTESMMVMDAWHYNQHTIKGDCGSLFYVRNPVSTTGRIAGFHVAGNANENSPIGWAAVLTREIVQQALDAFELEGPFPEPIQDLKVDDENIVSQGDLLILGTINKGINIPRDSQFVRTELWSENIFPHTKDLAVMRNDDPRVDKKFRGQNILWKAVSKYDKLSHGITPDEYRDLIEYYDGSFKILPKPEKTILSFKEGLLAEEMLIAKKMDPRTSMGYPYTQMGITKKMVFEAEEKNERTLAHELFDKRLEKARHGELFPTVWIDILKDEKRKINKIKEGKTRAFCVGPMDLNLLTRCYFLPYLDAMMQMRHVLWMQVGIDPESDEWNTLYARLVEFGGVNNICDADHENFDGKIHPIMWHLFTAVVNNWANDDGRVVRTILGYQHARRLVIAGNIVYTVYGGNPSGCGVTSGFNCFVNSTYGRLFWYRYTFNTTGLRCIANFDNHILDVNYGDDVLYSLRNVSTQSLMYFFSEFEKMGLNVTDGDKIGSPKRKNIKDATFLKRRFIQSEIDGLYYGALDLDSIYSMFHFVSKGTHYHMALYDNIVTGLRALTYHGRIVYNSIRNKLVHSPSVIKHNYVIPTFEELCLIIYFPVGPQPHDMEQVMINQAVKSTIEL